jgi:hypothetical protein
MTTTKTITARGRKPGMKAFNHYDGEDHLLRIIDDNGDEWDEAITGWDLILDLTTGRSFWRHRYDGREIESAFDI